MFLKDMKPNYDYRVIQSSEYLEFLKGDIVKVHTEAGIKGYIANVTAGGSFDPEEITELMKTVEVVKIEPFIPKKISDLVEYLVLKSNMDRKSYE